MMSEKNLALWKRKFQLSRNWSWKFLFFIWKILLFQLILDNERVIFRNLSQICRQGCDNCFLYIPRNFSRNFFLRDLQFFQLFGHWGEKNRLSVEKLLVWLSNMPSRCPWEDFDGKYYFLKNDWFFTSVSDLDQKLSAFYQKNSGGVFKIAIHVPIGTFWWQVHFFEKKLFYYNVYGHRVQNFGLFVQKVMAGLSELHSTCP